VHNGIQHSGSRNNAQDSYVKGAVRRWNLAIVSDRHVYNMETFLGRRDYQLP